MGAEEMAVGHTGHSVCHGWSWSELQHLNQPYLGGEDPTNGAVSASLIQTVSEGGALSCHEGNDPEGGLSFAVQGNRIFRVLSDQRSSVLPNL